MRIAFRLAESDSVDYAVMENTTRAAMVPADMDWSDIGNWDALHIAARTAPPKPRAAAMSS